MTRLLLLVVFLLCPFTLQAQQITDARPFLAGLRHPDVDTNASFAVGLLRPGDLAYQTAVYSGDKIIISGKVQPEAAHIDLRADIYTVLSAGDNFYTVDTAGHLAPWDGRVLSLVPRYTDVTLKASEDFVLFTGTAPQPGEYRVFIGYRPQATGVLYYTPIPQVLTVAAAPVPVAQCLTFGGSIVPVWHTTADGAFTHAPFAATDLNLITNGKDTNDSRFSYQWVKRDASTTEVTPINIYAPADGILIRLRHKARNLPEFDSDDYDLFFLVACDPSRPDLTSVVRFNHITEPRSDIKAAYAFGSLGAPVIGPGGLFEEHEERQVPLTNIVVRAGDYLGRTSGTPLAHDFDFMISVDDASVCPFSVLAEPFRTQLLNMLGPQSASPFGPPQGGYPCEGYGARP